MKGEPTMDFRFRDDVESFRAEVRAFFASEMAPDRTNEHSDPADLTGLDEGFERQLHARCGDRGYLGLTVEPSMGGLGRTISYQATFNFEAAACGAPTIDTAMTLAGHPIVDYGSAAQKEFFLPRMLSGEIEMCIAYTEEAAGSDLGAIATVATPTDDGFVLNGTKVLVTGAHKADWCCTVARTRPDGKPRDGMSMFLVDMRAPGVGAVRRSTMNEWTLGEIHFADVHVSTAAVLGELNGGWRQLVSAVQAERSGMFYFGFATEVFALLVDFVRCGTRDGRPLAGDAIVRDRVAELHVDLQAGLRLAKRTLWMQERGESNTVQASMTKVYATEFLQRLAHTATEIAGLAGALHGPLFGPPPPYAAGRGRFAWEYLERVHGTISVGNNELQRDGIAQFGLGLPRPRR